MSGKLGVGRNYSGYFNEGNIEVIVDSFFFFSPGVRSVTAVSEYKYIEKTWLLFSPSRWRYNRRKLKGSRWSIQRMMIEASPNFM